MTDRELFEKTEEYIGKKVTLEGWIKNHRKQKEFGFISFSDGTFFTQVQIVYDNKLSRQRHIFCLDLCCCCRRLRILFRR